MFLTTTVYSIFAYIWLFIVLVLITPNEVTLWEAVITLLCFPLLVCNAYMAEKNFFLKSDAAEVTFNLSEMCKWRKIFYFKVPEYSTEFPSNFIRCYEVKECKIT